MSRLEMKSFPLWTTRVQERGGEKANETNEAKKTKKDADRLYLSHCVFHMISDMI